MSQVSMQVEIGALHMKNPVTVGSGTFAAGREYNDFVDVAALGAVTTKGVSLNGWPGNDGTRIAETPSGMLNSIGLQNPGVDHLIEEDLPWLQSQGATVIVNVAGHSVDEYVRVIERLEEAPLDAYEVNISCPNVDGGGMSFGSDPKLAAEVISACRKRTERPLIAKLTPNVTDIALIAQSVQDAGADAGYESYGIGRHRTGITGVPEIVEEADPQFFENTGIRELTLHLSSFETLGEDRQYLGAQYKVPALLSGSRWKMLTEFLGYLMTDIKTLRGAIRERTDHWIPGKDIRKGRIPGNNF